MKISIKLLCAVLLMMGGALALSGPQSVSTAFAQSDQQVTITNSRYEPKKITVPEGATVTWINQEGAHTVTEDNGVFVSKTLKPGDSFSYQFNKTGTYPYHCAIHGGKGGSGLAGTVVVVKRK